MKKKDKLAYFKRSDIISALLLLISYFLPWSTEPYNRFSWSPFYYVFSDFPLKIDFISIIFLLIIVWAIFTFISAFKGRKTRIFKNLTGILVIIAIFIIQFPYLFSYNRLTIQVRIGSIMAVLAAIGLLLPLKILRFTLLKSDLEPKDNTLIYLGTLLFLCCWLPWVRGYHSFFGYNLFDTISGSGKALFYLPLFIPLSGLLMIGLGLLKRNVRLLSIIAGFMVFGYLLMKAIIFGPLYLIYSMSIGAYMAIPIAAALLWTGRGKKLDEISIAWKNLLKPEVILASILALIFGLNLFSNQSQDFLPKTNVLFDMFVFSIPFFSILTVLFALMNMRILWMRRAAGIIAILFYLLTFLTGIGYYQFYLLGLKNYIAIIASLGMIFIRSNNKKVKEASKVRTCSR